MISYIFRRLLMTVPVMLIVALFVFGLLILGSGDPAAIMAGDQATSADIERIRQSLGLDQPFIISFFDWLAHVMRGDLGLSFYTRQPVAAIIAQRIEPTLHLMLITLIISISSAVPLGVLAASRLGSWIDNAVMAFSVVGFSVPIFVIGYILAYLLALNLGWFPVQGYKPISQGWFASSWSLFLPAIALSTGYVALIARVTRAAMLESLSQDYVRTAIAKGAPNRTILFVHALKNAAVPIVTVIGSGVAHLIGGSVAVEVVFAIPGLGRLTVDSILQRDYPVLQGIVLLGSFVYLVVNLVVDLIYVVLDPRIKY